MERTKLFSLIRYSFGSQGFRIENKTPRYWFLQRGYSNELKKSENKKEEIEQLNQPLSLFDYKRFMFPGFKVWNEKSSLRRAKRESKSYKKIQSTTDVIRYFQNWKKFPLSLTELFYYLKRRKVKNELISQQFLPRRHATLKPDLASAHFILHRGGQIKFKGQDWIGVPGVEFSLPCVYSPGYFIEGINAENTNLYFEGFSNLYDLRHLNWLSLKGLENMNDWCMDWISREYADTLVYLDISNCKNITYRGLSCFYRFNELKTLIVKDISDSPEFKVACLMLLDIKPDLEIEGIDLNIPQKIEPIQSEVKELESKTLV